MVYLLYWLNIAVQILAFKYLISFFRTQIWSLRKNIINCKIWTKVIKLCCSYTHYVGVYIKRDAHFNKPMQCQLLWSKEVGIICTLESPRYLLSPRGVWAFDELKRYHTRPSWGPENVHFGKTMFRDLNIHARVFI